jgi:hypothetical protein
VILYEPHRAATAFTAGFRAFPSSNLLIRANLATGILPPSAQDYVQSSGTPFILLADARRGTVPVRTRFTSLSGGSAGLRPERALSAGIGIVLNPDDERRVRASLDLIHIDKRDEINNYYAFNYAYFFANETVLTDRIVRAPLTAADIALGYTGGVVTQLDTAALNIGRTTIDTFDLALYYSFEIGAADTFYLHGLATWQPRFERGFAAHLPGNDYVGFADGALRWRAVAGIGWRNGGFGPVLPVNSMTAVMTVITPPIRLAWRTKSAFAFPRNSTSTSARRIASRTPARPAVSNYGPASQTWWA